MNGRYHCFSNSQDELIYNSTDINMLLKEIQKAQDVLNKIKEMRSGTLGSALIQIQNEVCTLIFSSTRINDIVQTVFTEVRDENLDVLRNSMDISIMNRREECEEQIRGNRNSASVKRRILQCIRDDNFWESEFTIVFNHWIQHTFYRVLTQEQVLEYLQTNRNERIDVVASSLLPPAPRPRNTNPRRR